MPAECCLPDCNVLAVKFGAGGTMLCFLFVCFFWGWPVPMHPFYLCGKRDAWLDDLCMEETDSNSSGMMQNGDCEPNPKVQHQSLTQMHFG